MNTIKLIKKLRRKTCTIIVFEDTTKEKGFWGIVRNLNGNTVHRTSHQYNAEEALELAKEHIPNQTPLKLRLTLDVEFRPHGVSEKFLKGNMEQVVTDAVNRDTLTGESRAEVEEYSFSVLVL